MTPVKAIKKLRKKARFQQKSEELRTMNIQVAEPAD
jgi:hypothetical protein